MELDRTAMPDMSVLIDGLDNTYHEVLKKKLIYFLKFILGANTIWLAGVLAI